jgi:N-sulfoglucosamine sulfohydrolase
MSLFIYNFIPDRWPAGNPPSYDDIDNKSPTKRSFLAMSNKDTLLSLATGKRPQEELYSVAQDPFQLNNLAYQKEYEAVKVQFKELLFSDLKSAGDPRVHNVESPFDDYPYWRPKK